MSKPAYRRALRWLGWALGAGLAVLAGYAGARVLQPVVLPASAALKAELRGHRDLPSGLVAALSPEPAPVPQPGLRQPAHLVLERLDGTPLLDVVPFDPRGEPRAAAFAHIDEVFAARGGEQTPIDPRLIELLMSLSRAYDGQPIALVSGHRPPGKGTRRTSYHVRGMAADIAVRGVKVHDLREQAVRLGAGGVGVYPTFVHVDVRRDQPYRWVGGRWPRRWSRR